MTNKFIFRAIDTNGKNQSGEIEAKDVVDATSQIESKKWTLQFLEQVNSTNEKSDTRISGSEKSELNQALLEASRANLPLIPSLKALCEESEFRNSKRALSEVIEKLESGASLDEVFSERSVSRKFRFVLKAGLKSGDLTKALSDFIADEGTILSIKRRVTLGLQYTVILFFMVAVLSSVLFVCCVPMLEKVYADFGVYLPETTSSLIALSHVLNKWGLTLVITLLSFLLAGYFFRSHPRVARIYKWILLRLPVVGFVFHSLDLSRMCKVLALLIENRIPLPVALRLAGEATDDMSTIQATRKIAGRIETGESVEEAISGLTLSSFPMEFLHVMNWGNDYEDVPEALRTTALIFESQANTQISVLLCTVPPLAMIFIAFYTSQVASIFLSPMLNLIENLGS